MVRSFGVYLFGRGLISLGVIATAMLAPPTIMGVAPALIFAIGGTALSGFMRLRAQAHYEDNMVKLYRDDIAQQLHIDPNEVTRSDLKKAAKGNDIIAEALHRQKRKNMVTFATAGLAGLATFGLISYGLAPHALTGWLTDTFNLGATAAKVLSFCSAGIVAGTTGLIVHDGLEAAIGHGTGLTKAAAHDLIFRMNRDVEQGKTVSPEQVYAVIVAGDPVLDKAIITQFRKPYAQMMPQERHTVTTILGVAPEMQQLATDISAGRLAAGHLAFVINEDHGMHIANRLTTQTEMAPLITHGHFVEKLGLAQKAQGSFAERIAAEARGSLITH